MPATSDLTEFQWQIAHAIANTLVQEKTDVNELGKIIAYLRAYIDREKAGVRFFDYLKTLANQGKTIARSQQTPRYYQSIERACSQYLEAYQDDAVAMLQILGWTSRLMYYYQKEPIGEITEPVSQSARQVEIASVLSTHHFAIGQTLEARVAGVKGNKVTYEVLGTIRLTQKEPKNAKFFSQEQVVEVEIADLKEDGSIKKLKVKRK